MKIRSFFLITFFVLLSFRTMACHKGGPQGAASGDLIGLTIDLTMSYSMSFTTTSGTSGCENWDLVQLNRVQYLDITFETLSEEITQGKGKHVEALSKMYGCVGEYEQTFESMLFSNYPHLFLDMSEMENYDRAHLLDYEINRLIRDYRFEDQCIYSSSS